jgi:hypothetical protein
MTNSYDQSAPPSHPTSIGNEPADASRLFPYIVQRQDALVDTRFNRAVSVHSIPTEDSELLQAHLQLFGPLTSGLPGALDTTNDQNGAHVVMQSVPGRTLSACIKAREQGEHIPHIADSAECTLSFIALCDILMSAHRRGFVHGRLTPECIICQDDVGVRIDGWDHAVASYARKNSRKSSTNDLVRREPDGLHDDIRELATILLSVLTGDNAFTGTSDVSSRTSPNQVQAPPPALLSVIRKATTSSAAEGYASIAEFRDELVHSIAGGNSPASKPDPATAYLQSFTYNQRAWSIAVILLLMAAGAVFAFNWKSVTTYATWGTPIVEEHFDTNSWKDQWMSSGTWEQINGRIVSKSDYETSLIYRQRLTPPVAIEYTGRFESARDAGDLSIWWCEGDAFSLRPGEDPDKQPGWFLQAAGMANSWCAVWKTPEQFRSQVNNLVLQPGVDHHFRVEILTDRLQMWIDSKLVLDHTELFPIDSGTIALFTYDAGKTFDDVRIWQKPVPELVSPLAVGDSAYRSGRFNDAEIAYSRVAQSHLGKELGVKALFFEGLAQHKSGDHLKANETWHRMPDGLLRHRAECLAIDELIKDGDIVNAVDRFTVMWKTHPDVHDILRQRWQYCAQQLDRKSDHKANDTETWFQLREAHFPNDKASQWIAANMLNQLGRWEEVIRRYPDERRAVAPAMAALGQNRDIAMGDWAIPRERIAALISMGRLEEALESPDLRKLSRAELLCKMGRAQEALAIGTYPALSYLGDINAALETNRFGWHANDALMVAGRFEEAAGDGVPGSPESGHYGPAMLMLGRLDEADERQVDTRLHRMLDLVLKGHEEDARLLRAGFTGIIDARRHSLWFVHYLGLALVDQALGDAQALENALRSGSKVTDAWGGRMELVCKAALDPSAEPALMAMPWITEAKAWLCIARALHAELSDDRTQTLLAWKAYTALPWSERMLDYYTLNVQLEAVVAWRIAALTPK